MKTIKNIKLPDGETYKIGGGLDDKITNCITEIPQDIKLELNNGVLTLKAGSKVYVPNGVGVFDEVVINSDLTYGGSSTNWSNTSWLVYSPNGTLFVNNGYYTSGSTYTGGTYGIWYDTTNNSVKFTTDGGSTWASGYSLPLAQITVKSGTGVTSIDQVFNGFGYIGSTVFVLPNVKGLAPNGRNEDGSLNNIERTVDKLYTQTLPSTLTNNLILGLNFRGDNPVGYWGYYVVGNDNFGYANGSVKVEGFPVAQYTATNGVVSNFSPKQPFRAVDYSEFNSTPHIVDTYRNGNSWYRIWSDGWCEQGGAVNTGATGGQSYQVTLLKPYNNNLYNATTAFNMMAGASVVRYYTYFILQTGLHNINFYSGDVVWSTAGYIT